MVNRKGGSPGFRRRALAAKGAVRAGAVCGARPGFSLLEVVLALAILGGAVAVTGELVRVGIESARIARDLTYAQLLCESKLAEITAGADVPEPVVDAPFETTEDASQPDWLYSIETTPLDDQGLMAVRVTVYKEDPHVQRPVTFSLDRWIIGTGGSGTTSGMGGDLMGLY